MLTKKYMDHAVLVLISLTVIVLLFLYTVPINSTSKNMEYEYGLFDNSYVHTLNIEIDDWEGFLAQCENEEYVNCNVTIDGETINNVGIRAKGNTSLTQVASYGNDRYSFKIEFDHYNDGVTYQGLDKLTLNNLIQDNTYMKDYISYNLMNYMGVSSPLTSYTYITVNGQDWGLYLAVESIEESFLQRNYGDNYGNLYKPDSQSIKNNDREMGQPPSNMEFPPNINNTENNTEGNNNFPTNPPGQSTADTLENPPEQPTANTSENPPEQPTADTLENPPEQPTADTSENPPEQPTADTLENPPSDNKEQRPNGRMGNSSSDTLLVYTDDNYENYQSIFENAKTEITNYDKDRLIQSIKQLNSSENIESVVDTDQVIRYFVAHNFLCNFDSYTGSMVHNYYLYEKDGVLSMLPWDYNLAFGGFMSSDNATDLINYPIDEPVSGLSVEERPMLSWIFSDETYTDLYHQYFSQLIENYFNSNEFEKEITETYNLIAPYVEKDPTKFCTYEEFQKGVETLKEFCILRGESISGQLEGTIPSTLDEQNENSSSLIDGSSLDLNAMGSMHNRMGNGENIPNPFSENNQSFITENMNQEFTSPTGNEFPANSQDKNQDTFNKNDSVNITDNTEPSLQKNISKIKEIPYQTQTNYKSIITSIVIPVTLLILATIAIRKNKNNLY